ncbi:MAG: protease complex subunit PrcB family protein [Nevskia sp.]|nr:protease complex subunit PrcB family protein [Nevskia sp.]
MRFIPIPPFKVASLLGCAWLAACSGVPGTARVPFDAAGDEVEVREIRQLSACAAAGTDAAVHLLADEQALRDWQQARGIDLIGPGALPPGPFAVVDHGARPTAGYGLAVSRRAKVGYATLTLVASFLGPKTDNTSSGAPTSPCVLVALPAGAYRRIVVIDPSGRRRAMSQAAAS